MADLPVGERAGGAGQEQDPRAAAKDVVALGGAEGDVAQEDAAGVVPAGVAEDLGVDPWLPPTYRPATPLPLALL
jgi:hypothetical protein